MDVDEHAARAPSTSFNRMPAQSSPAPRSLEADAIFHNLCVHPSETEVWRQSMRNEALHPVLTVTLPNQLLVKTEAENALLRRVPFSTDPQIQARYESYLQYCAGQSYSGDHLVYFKEALTLMHMHMQELKRFSAAALAAPECSIADRKERENRFAPYKRDH